eukprot:238834_1
MSLTHCCKSLSSNYTRFSKGVPAVKDVKKQLQLFPGVLSRSNYRNYDDDYFQEIYNPQLPILYVIADTGVLANNICTNQDFINELTNHNEEKTQPIAELLSNNNQEQEHKHEIIGNHNNKQQQHKPVNKNNNNIFFRIIIHKCATIINDTVDNPQSPSNYKHFALIWITDDISATLIDLLIGNGYWCNAVDKDCAYLSGNFDDLYDKIKNEKKIPQFVLHKFEQEIANPDDNICDNNYHAMNDMNRERKAFAFIWGTKSYKLDRFHTEITINRENTKADIEVTGIISAFNFRNAILIIMQCLLLPFFTILPPVRCQKHKSNSDRHIAEKVIMDIGAIFTEYKFGCKCCHKCNYFIRRLIAVILSFMIYYTVLIGPFLYDHTKTAKRKGCANLLFFDCFGPIIFYLIAVITIIWWSGIEKKYSSPQQNKLLYHQMINIPQKPMDAYLYAEQRGFFELCEPKHGLISLKPFKSKFGKMNRILLMISCIIPLFIAQNWEKFWCKVPPFYIEKQELSPSTYFQHYTYDILSNLFSLLSVFAFMLLWESMFVRLELYRDNVMSLLELITHGNDNESINLLNKNNLLSWKELQQFVKKKGMILFASLEAPLLSLWILGLFSWIGFFYCTLNVILNDRSENKPLFSNSAFVTWIYLAILTGFETGRMLFWYGLQFSKAAEQIDSAIKKQSVMLKYKNIALQMVEYNTSSKEKQCLMKQVAKLSENMNYDGVIPTAFGWIKFDRLTATAAWSIVVAAIPALYQIIQMLLNGMRDSSSSSNDSGYILNCNMDITNGSASSFNCTKH